MRWRCWWLWRHAERTASPAASTTTLSAGARNRDTNRAASSMSTSAQLRSMRSRNSNHSFRLVA
jgi:hypothetical protein